MIIGGLGQRASQRVNVEAQVAFLNEAVGPDAPHQLVLAHDIAVAFDQRQQCLKGLRPERHDRAVTNQQSFHSIQAERTELVSACHRSLPHRAKKKKERLRGSLRTIKLIPVYPCLVMGWQSPRRMSQRGLAFLM